MPWRTSHDLNIQAKKVYSHTCVSLMPDEQVLTNCFALTHDCYWWKLNSIFPKIIPKRCLMLTFCRNCEWILNLNGIETSFKKFAQQTLFGKNILREFKNSRIIEKIIWLERWLLNYLPLISYQQLLSPLTWNWGWIKMTILQLSPGNFSLTQKKLCISIRKLWRLYHPLNKDTVKSYTSEEDGINHIAPY